MLEGVSTSDLLMYIGIFVLACALIVLVLWVAKISSKMTALKQAVMIEQRKLEELAHKMGADGVYPAPNPESNPALAMTDYRQMKPKKHGDEVSAELRRQRELAREREEQLRSFQKQQEALRQRMALEQAQQEAEEERLNKLRIRASWSESTAASRPAAAPRPHQRMSTARLEERRQAQLRRQAEEIIQTHLGNAGETNHFDNPADLR